MEEYTVDITEAAYEDLQAIRVHIADELKSPLNAAKQLERIAGEILSLDILPERYSVVEAEPWRSRGIRHMPVDNYTVFYLIKGNRVIVTDALYSASDLIARLRKQSGEN